MKKTALFLLLFCTMALTALYAADQNLLTANDIARKLKSADTNKDLSQIALPLQHVQKDFDIALKSLNLVIWISLL